MPLRPELVEILVCPKCKGALEQQTEPPAFVCRACALVYAIEGDVPNFLIDEARPLS